MMVLVTANLYGSCWPSVDVSDIRNLRIEFWNPSFSRKSGHCAKGKGYYYAGIPRRRLRVLI